jgi:AraC-like DNA-binding protein
MKSAPEPITVSVTVLEQMFLYLASLHVDSDAFLRSIGLDPVEVRCPDTRLSIETYLQIQDAAAAYTRDPCFGLHMGEFAEAGSWSILGYLMMNCRSIREAFEKAGRYAHIIGNLIEGSVHIQFRKVKLVLFSPPYAPEMSRHCFEATISSFVRLMRTLTGKPIGPSEVRFIYPRSESTAEYERVFRCPVLFGQKETSITVETAVLDTPVLMANPGLLEYFENYAQDFLAGMNRGKEHTRAVTRIILARLDDEKLSIDRVAKELSISVRTLQNRLSEEGVVFSDLLQSVRESLARKYLRENYTVEQITYMLGFSEASVFRKAFKKWAGITPREYRNEVFPNCPGVEP